MSQAIANKVVLVTGANRGIGKQIVDSFLAEGARKVYLAVRDPASAAPLEQAYGERVQTLAVDISDPASVTRAAQVARDVDIVINNAGVLVPSNPLDDNGELALDKELDVNLYGLLRVARAFAPALEANGGTLVQINSVVSIRNFSGFGTYSISKAASYSLTQALRETLQPKGVKVISVHPGPIATDMGAQAGFDNAASTTVVADSIVQALEGQEFHVFPDDMAKQFWAGYQSYAKAFVEADILKEG
ncbi:SDR family oxidoreductase [Bowmanella dokdonensis]|uniref:SDR family oxidoreductase n=1 Tax=Bowmanella dokdonensis TaxID=751969 RepID=A0A939DNB9_9ALTE|nr:SDR family oxidoreductase [Bowmanella dokdonensis]MBN7825280.1 SDR family oxidoreductase [Bowmanella dokdonensis]